MMVKAIPELVTFRTAARARGVSTLSGVTGAPRYRTSLSHISHASFLHR